MEITLTKMADPETNAMLQAFYSRSHTPIKERLLTLASKKKSIKRSLHTYYVNYGHDSIADCGVITLYFENVSLLLAKALQDSGLYNGQESSTRFISFSKADCINPLMPAQKIQLSYQQIDDVKVHSVSSNKNNIRLPDSLKQYDEVKDIMEGWLHFYREQQLKVEMLLLQKFSYYKDEHGFADAIKAKTFDVTRSLLPAGLATNLSWTTSLRKCKDMLISLLHHPCSEMNLVANNTLSLLEEVFPDSFNLTDTNSRFNACSDYFAAVNNDEKSNFYYYYDEEARHSGIYAHGLGIKFNNYGIDLNYEALNKRKWLQPLPNYVAQQADYQLKFLLDFGSFRDLQRHRKGYCAMPLLTDEFGFNKQYLEYLPEGTDDFIEKQLDKIDKVKLSPEEKQYLYPLGMNVCCLVKYDLGELIYIAERRSTSDVHFTLRKIAQSFGHVLEDTFPNLKVHVNYSDTDDLSIRRGQQTIIQK